MGSRRGAAVSLVLFAAAVVVWWSGWLGGPGPAHSSETGEAALRAAFAAQRSGVMVEAQGTVVRLLPDDEEGSRHQRFVVRVGEGHTVLVSHNIDLAPRAPVEREDAIRFRGQYEWNELGGVVHWTHHDPAGRRAGGWLELEGRRYE